VPQAGGVRRVLFIAYHFPPTGGSGVQRSSKFVRYLPDCGFEPVVVTGPGEAGGRWTPGDASLGSDVPEGTEVLRVPGPVPGDGSGWGWRARRFALGEHPFDAWWSAGVYALARRRHEVDLVYASMSPFSSALPAAELAAHLGVPWVADLRDPWALDEYFAYPTFAHWRLEQRRMRRRLATAAAVVLPTPGTLARFLDFFPEFAGRAIEIRNGFDPGDFAGPPPRRRDGALRVVHAGYSYGDLGRRRLRRLLGGTDFDVDARPRSPAFLLEAMRRLLAERPELRARLRLHLAGPLTDVDRASIAGSGCADVVEAHGYLPHAQAVELVRSADVLFLPMHRLPPGARSTIVPGKAYEYLASGRPILAAVPAGDPRDLLEGAAWTVVCEPDDADGIAAGLRALLERADARRTATADRGRLVEPFTRPHLAHELARTFERVLAGATSSSPRSG
jgi:glycosyltransferase involved in cell wall biosynthesis